MSELSEDTKSPFASQKSGATFDFNEDLVVGVPLILTAMPYFLQQYHFLIESYLNAKY